ncbi:TRAP transporter large permease [uncultured Sneathiella sp.]|uniref:TRAP transporter large permease n=1 Tax=uncultured Sneathiella sp. TaxID=879315 RepID=UPI0030ECF84E|tara:strand:- start:5412 stop:6725 length:1314 start_codon:yes stop_codon:yes gene_type:complete
MTEPIFLGIAGIFSVLAIGAMGIPVAYALLTVGIVGMWHVGGFSFLETTIKMLPYAIMSNYSFAVIPMFLLMGALASAADITTELYAFANRLLFRVRGGLLMATVVASAIFAAISGSTIVNASVFTRIALPEMKKFGYDLGISAGCIAAAGTFAALIPPSISLVIVGLLTEASIGALLIGGIVPGVLTAFMYILGIAVLVRIRPSLVPTGIPQTQHVSIFKSMLSIGPALLLMFIVLGGIYTGVMFPSSAGAVGAAGALLIAIARRKMNFEKFWMVVRSSAGSTATLFFIVIGGLFFSRFLTFGGFIHEVTALVSDWQLSQTEFLIALSLLYLLLGMFLDTLSILLVTIPFLFPIALSLGINEIWFGILVVKLIEIAAITPPVGLNLFAVMGASEKKIPSKVIMSGVIPFIMIELVTLGLIIYFPQIAIWLPSEMIK